MPKKTRKEGAESSPSPEGQTQTFEVGVADLREALELLAPVVPRKPTLSVLSNIRLGDGRAVATDLEVLVKVDLPQAQEPVLLPQKEALEFLRFATGYETAHVTRDRDTVAIAAGHQQARLRAPDPEEFPPVPEAATDGEGVLDGDALVRALAAVLPCAATDDTRPVLSGVCLTPGDRVEVAAADGYRLAWEAVPGRLAGEAPMVIPSRAVVVLEHLWKKAPKAPEMADISDPARLAVARRLIRLGWGKEALKLQFGGVTLMVRLTQGSFPNYHQLIPTETASSVTVLAEEVERALRQLQRVARDGSGIVRLAWEGDRLSLSARAEEMGETTVAVGASCSGPGRVALNIGYLLTYFGGRQGQVTLSLAPSDGAPVRFAHRGVEHLAVMPMFLREDQPVQEAATPEGPQEVPPVPKEE